MPAPVAPEWWMLAFWTKDSSSVRDLVFVVASIIGGALLLWRTINHDRQTKAVQSNARTAAQGHITDRINKAIENLGTERRKVFDNQEVSEPNLEVRIGAIYALERIAQDSERDHIPIMETLCAYIRENAPASSAQESDYLEEHVNKILFDRSLLLEGGRYKLLNEQWRKLARQEHIHRVGPSIAPRADIQSALNVIGRRSRERIAYEIKQTSLDELGYCLDLRWTNLQGANLCAAHFDRAKFANARLDAADMEGAELMQASLSQASLCKTNLSKANLNGAYLGMAEMFGVHLASASLERAYLGQAKAQYANLWAADLRQADCRWANFTCADFAKAAMAGANFEEADLSRTVNLERSQLESVFGSVGVKLPEGLSLGDFPLWPQERLNSDEMDQRYADFLVQIS
ncbi:MAG: hypothetical protein QOG84_364 [Sphingomonadales bacterium]|nr:hypothetical protein [Sphingomonadales bacterium]